MVLLFTFFLLSFYFLPFPLHYFTPQSHLHIGLPFGTPIPCLQTKQVGVCGGFIFVIPALMLFAFLVHAGATKLLPSDSL